MIIDCAAKKKMNCFLEAKLKAGRLSHTYGVVQTAVLLAELYGADPEKAEIAALFHDAYRERGNLSHGEAAADALKRDYDVCDEDILNAVRFHTTGRAAMSLLEKILYLADAIEPGRNYPGVSELRESAYQDLDQALLLAFEHTIDYVSQRGEQLDSNTLEAKDYLKEREIHE